MNFFLAKHVMNPESLSIVLILNSFYLHDFEFLIQLMPILTTFSDINFHCQNDSLLFCKNSITSLRSSSFNLYFFWDLFAFSSVLAYALASVNCSSAGYSSIPTGVISVIIGLSSLFLLV